MSLKHINKELQNNIKNNCDLNWGIFLPVVLYAV